MKDEWNSVNVTVPFWSFPDFGTSIDGDDTLSVEDSVQDLRDSLSSNESSYLGDNNVTMAHPSGVPPEFLVMSADSRNCVVAYVFLFVIAATGNFSVFFSVLQQLRRTKSRISVFILHLSLADLLVTFGVIPLEVVWRITVQWYGGNILCKFCKFFSAFGLYLSSFVLICISMDRYFVIIHPLRVTDARRRGRLMLMAAWIMATLCSFPQVFIFHVESHPKYPSFQQCVSLGFFSSAGEELVYNVFSISFMYFIPLMIVIFTYVMIICKISRKSRQHSESRKQPDDNGGRILLRRSDASNHMERARNRTLKLTCLIVTVFVLCSTPYVVMTLWYMLDRESAEKVDGKIQDALFIMVVSNSCFNPVVYGTFTRECRESMTNCFGYAKGRDPAFGNARRDVRGGRFQADCDLGQGCRGLRRQSQLKMMYTTSKRPTSKAPLQSQTLDTVKAVNPLTRQFPVEDPPPKPLSSYRLGYSNSSMPTSMATLNDGDVSPGSPIPGGTQGRFFRDSNGSFQRRPNSQQSQLRQNGGGSFRAPSHLYPPPRSASLNPNFLGNPPPIAGTFIREESEVISVTHRDHNCQELDMDMNDDEDNVNVNTFSNLPKNCDDNLTKKGHIPTKEEISGDDEYSIRLSTTTATVSKIGTSATATKYATVSQVIIANVI